MINLIISLSNWIHYSHFFIIILLLFRYYFIVVLLLFRHYFIVVYYFDIISLLFILCHYRFSIISLLFRYYFMILPLLFRYCFVSFWPMHLINIATADYYLYYNRLSFIEPVITLCFLFVTVSIAYLQLHIVEENKLFSGETRILLLYQVRGCPK